MFTLPLDVRYLETDQQGVVFNMWYLAYFEDARNALLADAGFSLLDLLESGHDIQVVHSEIDWFGAVRWPDHVEIATSVAAMGTTSLTFDFEVRRDGEVLVSGRTVYVIFARAGLGKRPVPDDLRRALGAPHPLRGATA